MATAKGVDYAWSHPGGAALKEGGYVFACRYLSGDTSKNLTRKEADDLAAHGVSSVVVWETTANRARAGRTAGISDAKKALAQAQAAGMPAGRPVYFAVDYDAPEKDQGEIDAYLTGAGTVIGAARVGVYGGYHVVKRCLDNGSAHWAWQTIAWSGGQWDARAKIRQGAQKKINGVSCDLNTAMTADYGQWTPGKAPAAQEKEDDMDPVDVWAFKGRKPGEPSGSKVLDPHDAYAYLRGTNADVQTLGKKIDSQGKTIAAMAATIADLAKSKSSASSVAASVDRLTAAVEAIHADDSTDAVEPDAAEETAS